MPGARTHAPCAHTRRRPQAEALACHRARPHRHSARALHTRTGTDPEPSHWLSQHLGCSHAHRRGLATTHPHWPKGSTFPRPCIPAAAVTPWPWPHRDVAVTPHTRAHPMHATAAQPCPSFHKPSLRRTTIAMSCGRTPEPLSSPCLDPTVVASAAAEESSPVAATRGPGAKEEEEDDARRRSPVELTQTAAGP